METLSNVPQLFQLQVVEVDAASVGHQQTVDEHEIMQLPKEQEQQ